MEKIVKEGKELETVLEEFYNESNLSKNDIYYTYKVEKSGLFNKKESVSVSIYMKKDVLEYVKNYLEELLTNMGLTVNFETKLREEVLYIKIYSDHNPIIIGKNGNTLKSLETIVKQKINTDLGIRPLINLDVENYREKQERRLERMAKNLAKDVVKTKMEVHLENMNAYDRRIVHNALTNFKGVKTESEDEEPNRHIVIKPE